MLTALAAIVIFGVIVLLHELGHFLAARHFGVRVEEFSIGFGPAVFSRRGKNGTLYSVRMLPLGGYNMLAQENGPAPDAAPQDTAAPPLAQGGRVCVGGRTYPEAGVWQRFFIIAAGAVMNFVLGFALLILLQCAQEGVATRIVYDFLPGATSSAGGLQAGDKILAVNGHNCFVWGDILYEIDHAGYQPVEMVVLRGGARVRLPAVRVSPATDAEGNELPIDFHVYGVKNSPATVLQGAAGNFLYYARALARSFLDLFRGATPVSDLSGPVGVIEKVHEAVQYGWRDVVSLAVLLTINLGIFNLLPLPGLDGGKLAFLLIEGVTGHKVPARFEQAITVAGMLLLVGLMFYVTFNDVTRFF